MKVEQLYTGCLAEAAYYIESEGEAVIIDPLRETQPYIDRAKEDGATIKYILETHFHADFVSGHLDLAKKTGAAIVFGPTAQPNFKAHIATDGEVLKVGKVSIKVLHTPGHTMESSSFLLRDEKGKDYAVFTGDTLFIGDVGRPDLAVKTDLSREDLASHLFDSLRNKIMPLADDVIVYPGHGAGSACGKKMAKETESTIGHQKLFNYALRADMTREEFIKEVLTGLVEPPQYFPKNAVMNKMGYDSIDVVMQRGLVPRTTVEFAQVAEQEGALVLDTRKESEFVKGFIPGSVSIGLDGQFASWVGTLISDLKQPILLVTEPGREEETVTRLARVGYDNTLGFLKGGFEAWKKAGNDVDTIESISPQAFAKRFAVHRENVLDVRRESEFNTEHVVGAQNFPLDFINRNMDKLDRSATYLVHCAGGYRSVIAISILQARGFNRLVNVENGFKGIKETGLVPVTEYAEQLTEL
ncbi:MAG: Hydroxyacylglutathione hydrolase [Saprospiraceae bacterium]|nr:Hydroxyacylglutathione hydrolase [Saprospiraceae bacterium]